MFFKNLHSVGVNALQVILVCVCVCVFFPCHTA